MSSVKSTEMTGGCLCGGVRYRITGPVRPIRYCHCSQCRRTSGHFVAATAVKTEELIFETNKSLAWFDSSEFASRGFCVRCGSSLFWKSKNRETISISDSRQFFPLAIYTSFKQIDKWYRRAFTPMVPLPVVSLP